MNDQVFFDLVRKSLFRNKLTAEQVNGMTAILKEFKQRGTRDRRHLAYLLATAYHETGTRMVAVREGQQQRKLWSDAQARNAVAKLFKQGKIKRNYALPGSYGNSFYGRGMAQITHEENYKKLGDILGIDLVRYPDKALENDVAAAILVEGSLKGISLKGDFTKYALEDFIVGDKCDYIHARQVINRMDRAADVAGYAIRFDQALETAGYEHVPYKPKKNAGRQGMATPVAATISNKEELLGIQKKLRELGYFEVGKADGLWGDRTETAVLAFRKDNGLELTPKVDDQFKAVLWSAAPRPVAEERANATLKEIKSAVPGVKELSFAKKALGFIGVGSMASGGVITADDISGITEKVGAVKSLFAVLPSPGTLFILGLVGLVGYYFATRVGSKVVKAYREGRIL